MAEGHLEVACSALGEVVDALAAAGTPVRRGTSRRRWTVRPEPSRPAVPVLTRREAEREVGRLVELARPLRPSHGGMPAAVTRRGR